MHGVQCFTASSGKRFSVTTLQLKDLVKGLHTHSGAVGVAKSGFGR